MGSMDRAMYELCDKLVAVIFAAFNLKEEIRGRNICLLAFHTTGPAYTTTHPQVFLLLRVY
jgi:hypothetical protein